jgi:imidazolonepropionase-like amidohydrolase
MHRTVRSFVGIAGVVGALLAIVLLLPEPEPGAGKTVRETGGAAQRNVSGGRPAVAVTGVRLFDGVQVIDDATVVFADGRVVAAGVDIAPPEDAQMIAGDGRTLLPGLIDAHVHAYGPALRDAARFGVTTVLDMFRPPTDFERTHAARNDRGPGDRADLFSAGYLATVAGGHGTQYGIDVPAVNGPAAAEDWVQARLDEGSDWIKIVIEDGSLFGGQLPTLDADTVRALVTAAHRREALAVAHVTTADNARIAIDAGVDGLVHLFGDAPIDQGLLARAAREGIFVVPTATVMPSTAGDAGRDWLREQSRMAARLGALQRQTLDQAFPIDDRSGWAHLTDNLQWLHAAGVPVLAGSDAPNPGTAHGASLHHELLLMTRSGFSPLEALRAATSVTAAAFGLDGRGCLQPGCIADALLVDGNPLRDITATTRIARVWKNGHSVALGADAGESDPADTRSPTADDAPIDLLGDRGRWMASADEFMGGASRSELAWEEAELGVTGALAPGFAFPYAGAMWSPTERPMQPADHSAYEVLVLRVDGPSDRLQAMLFSGAGAGAPPVRVPLESGERNEIDLSELAALDRARLRGVGVFAVGGPAPVAFTIREAVLE